MGKGDVYVWVDRVAQLIAVKNSTYEVFSLDSIAQNGLYCLSVTQPANTNRGEINNMTQVQVRIELWSIDGEKIHPKTIHTNDPVDVESQYFSIIKADTSTFDYLDIHSCDHNVVLPAHYYVGNNPPPWGRESEIPRLHTIWAPSAAFWKQPSDTIVRGLLKANNWTQLGVCKRLDVSHSTFKRWLTGHTRMPFAAWKTMLSWNGETGEA